jgi:hypothetical protein
MEQRPVVVRDNMGGTALIAIFAIVVIAALGLFFWQPWNATATHTTIINQPAANGNAGSSNANGAAGTSGTTGTTSGTTTGGTTSGASH